MGRRGPLPKDPEQAKLDGNTRRQKKSTVASPGVELILTAALTGVMKPFGLGQKAGYYWDDLTGGESGLSLRSGDEGILAAHCRARQYADELQDRLDNGTFATEDARYNALRALNAQSRIVTETGNRLGLAPASRSRAPVVLAAPVSKFGDLLEGRSVWDADKKLFATPTARGVVFTTEKLHGD